MMKVNEFLAFLRLLCNWIVEGVWKEWFSRISGIEDTLESILALRLA
jgi:hypothetical protein